MSGVINGPRSLKDLSHRHGLATTRHGGETGYSGALHMDERCFKGLRTRAKKQDYVLKNLVLVVVFGSISALVMLLELEFTQLLLEDSKSGHDELKSIEQELQASSTTRRAITSWCKPRFLASKPLNAPRCIIQSLQMVSSRARVRWRRNSRWRPKSRALRQAAASKETKRCLKIAEILMILARFRRVLAVSLQI